MSHNEKRRPIFWNDGLTLTLVDLLTWCLLRVILCYFYIRLARLIFRIYSLTRGKNCISLDRWKEYVGTISVFAENNRVKWILFIAGVSIFCRILKVKYGHISDILTKPSGQKIITASNTRLRHFIYFPGFTAARKLSFWTKNCFYSPC